MGCLTRTERTLCLLRPTTYCSTVQVSHLHICTFLCTETLHCFSLYAHVFEVFFFCFCFFEHLSSLSHIYLKHMASEVNERQRAAVTTQASMAL